MVDAVTGNTGMNVPARGADVNTWDTPVVANFVSLDAKLGGVLSLTLTAAATTTLTLPSPNGTTTQFTPTPTTGATQSQNAMIKLSGTLTGNNVIVCTMPGFYIVYNNCTVGSFAVTMSNGAGSAIGLPPGALWHVFNDGSNYYHCNLPVVGTLQHLCLATTPAWITASTLPPFIGCDGSVYNISAYPNLGAQLGSTFGGNGATTFGVPDLRGRYPLAIDYTLARVTAAGSGVNGAVLGTTGGNELMQSHTHAFTGTQQTWPLNSSNVDLGTVNILYPGSGTPALGVSGTGTPNVTVTPAGTNATTGSGSSQNMPPVQVTGIWLIRAA